METLNHFIAFLSATSVKTLTCGIVLPFVVAMLVTQWIHPFIVRMARERHMMDNPDARKLQQNPVPVLGGLAVFFGIVIGAGAVSMVFDSNILFTYIVVLTMMMYIGMLDDMIGLSPRLRLLLQVIMILFVMQMEGIGINSLHGLFGIGNLPAYVAYPLCAFACCGIINSINLIDGVDGLSSGYCIFACLCFGFMFFVSYDLKMAVMALLAAGALVPFWFHNVFGKTSKMFIGDSGTLMMGVLMSIFCMTMMDDESSVASYYPHIGVAALCLSILSVPVFDTLRVMGGRMAKGISPFHADKSHLHHLFIQIGFSHMGTAFSVLLLNLLNVVCWCVAYLSGANVTLQFLVVMFVGLATTFGFHYVVRRLSHEALPYRILARLARYSHKEKGNAFLTLRKWADR